MIRDGYAYYYMDVNAPKWTFGKVPINNTGQAVSHTLQQIYDNHKSKVVYVIFFEMYSIDSCPVIVFSTYTKYCCLYHAYAVLT